MAIVRVPKEHRPPSRYKPFFVNGSGIFTYEGMFKVVGVFRAPKYLEYYWVPHHSYVYQAGDISGPDGNFTSGRPFVILERLP